MISWRWALVALSLVLLLAPAEIQAKGLGTGREEEDPVYRWIGHPEGRDPDLCLAFVEIVSVANERYVFSNASNGKVSDDSGKTWYNLRKVRTGTVTLKVIESPGAAMPSTLPVYFESGSYVPTRTTPWVDQRVLPGKRLLGFFRKEGEKWRLETTTFIDPVDYLLAPSPTRDLQALFKAELATKAAVEAKRKGLEEVTRRAASKDEN